jgi:hypothetical protein
MYILCASFYGAQIANEKAHKSLQCASKFGFNQSDSILYYCEKGLSEITNNTSDSIIYFLHARASSAAQFTGIHSKAMKHALAALKMAEQHKRRHWIMASNNTIGLILLFSGRTRESLPYFEKSLEDAIVLSNIIMQGTCYNNIANVYLNLKEIAKSLNYRIKALHIRSKLGQPSPLGDTYNDIGETFNLLNNPDSAVFYLNHALKIKMQMGDSEMIALIHWNLARSAKLNENEDEAETHLKKAIAFALPLGLYNYAAGIARELTEIYEKKKKIAEAYEWTKYYIIYNDSSQRLENKQQLNALMEEFQSEKRELEIKALMKEKEQNEWMAEQRSRQKNFIVAGVLLLLIVILIYSFFLYKRYKHSRHQNIIIDLQKREVEAKQKEILDSIHYAKRIQNALISSEYYITKSLKRVKNKQST